MSRHAPDQLALDVEEPLVFVACRADGTPIATVPVEGGDWHAAALWCYLAITDDAASSA